METVKKTARDRVATNSARSFFLFSYCFIIISKLKCQKNYKSLLFGGKQLGVKSFLIVFLLHRPECFVIRYALKYPWSMTDVFLV